MRKVVVAVLAAVVALGLLAAGCGGGDETTITTSTGASGASGATGAAGQPLTKTSFIAQADAICQRGNKEVNAEGKKIFGNLPKGQKPSQQQQESFANDTLIPNIQNQVDAIRALTPPSGDEDQVKAITDAAQQAIDQAKSDPSSLFQNGNDPFAKADKLATDYGLKVCGEG